jgi:hypothetical protein
VGSVALSLVLPERLELDPAKQVFIQESAYFPAVHRQDGILKAGSTAAPHMSADRPL